MSQENVDGLRAYCATWGMGEQPALDLLDPEVVFEDDILPDHAGESYRGHEGVIRSVQTWLEPYERLAIDLEEIVGSGDRLVSIHRFRSTARYTGIVEEMRFAYLRLFRDGQVIYFRSFRDLEQALDAAGLREEAVSRDNVEVVRAAAEAYLRRDVEALLELLHPQIEWHPALPVLLRGEGAVYRGHDGARQLARETDEAMSAVDVVLSELHDLGEQVAAVGHWVIHGRESGADIESPLGLVVDFREGKILRIRSYLDPTEALEAVGLRD